MAGCLLPPDAPGHWCDRRRKTVVVPSPAAGVDWSIRVPVAEAWDVRSMVATLTTAVAVANREASLQVADETVVVARYKPSAQQAASLVRIYGLVLGGPVSLDATLATVSWGGPTRLLIHPGRLLSVVTAALQAADQWSAVALDVLYELNRGAGAAKRYAAWRRQEEGGLPEAALRSHYREEG